MARKNSYTITHKGPLWIRPVTVQLQKRDTRNAWTVSTKGTFTNNVVSR